jgi:surface carbohydrate biosynthesis protein
MKNKKPTLLIPVENQVRELDAKLLLSCIAARRGFTAIIGPKTEMEARIAFFPRSIYIAKSMVQGNSKFLRIAREVGHVNVAWDEEALVHLPAETYYSRRFSAIALANISHLFAWGQDNAELWRQYPQLPASVSIHATGNPRSDLLRSEIRAYYQKDVNKIRRRLGNFILINTNFNHVNAFLPGRNLFRPIEQPGEEPRFGRAARGMTLEYAEGLRDFKQIVFESFQKMIPALERIFEDHKIVVRPHPTENQDIYKSIAARCQRVHVTNQGNVVPWLMSANALIHNGCTTGVEAYALRVPAISFRATINEKYDHGFYALPNQLSHQCFDFDQLQKTLTKILSGDLGPIDGEEQTELIDRHLSGLQGPLVCEQITDVLEKVVDRLPRMSKIQIARRIREGAKSAKRKVLRKLKKRGTTTEGFNEFQRHKYPEILIEEIHSRLNRFNTIIDNGIELTVDKIYGKLFQIRARR